MGKGTGAARTHSGQQRGTTATVDDGPFIDQQSCPPLTKGVEFIHLKGYKLVFKKVVVATRLYLPLGGNINIQ